MKKTVVLQKNIDFLVKKVIDLQQKNTFSQKKVTKRKWKLYDSSLQLSEKAIADNFYVIFVHIFTTSRYFQLQLLL